MNSPRPVRQCQALGCVQPVSARGRCRRHYSRWYRSIKEPQGCRKEGCGRDAMARGLCHRHYRIARKSEGVSMARGRRDFVVQVKSSDGWAVVDGSLGDRPHCSGFIRGMRSMGFAGEVRIVSRKVEA